MSNDRPVAVYFITFSTYGSHLHGDERGSVDAWHNRFGELPMGPRSGLERYERSLLKSDPVVLDTPMRHACEDAIRERCRFMGWGLLALNVRTNHLHVVVSSDELPEKVMTSFKARSTTAMRTAGLIGGAASVWTRHGSTRRLRTDRDVERAVVYVTEAQGADLP